MKVVPISEDGQVIALACSNLALQGDRSIKPLTAREWHGLSERLIKSKWERPSELMRHTPAELHRELGLEIGIAERLTRLLARGGQLAFELERLAGKGIWVITRADETYPQRLKRLLGAGAPPVLYGSGPQEVLRARALAIVGSRDASNDALSFARGLAHECARSHVAVISGGARGVDLEAMEAAIEAGGVAVGVTVEPLERLVRRPMLRMPLTEGTLTLVTPFHPAARWQASNAMRRNRIVYAMSSAAVVAATAAGSGGTWTGAIENLKHGWVPLYVRDGADEGGDALARAGAVLLPGPPIRGIDVNRLFQVPDSAGRLGESQQTPVGKERNEEVMDVAPAEDSLMGEVGTHSQEIVVRAMSPSPTADQDRSEASDVFWAVWPLLEASLKHPRGDREIAEELDLQLGQARTWLDRAVQEGLASVQKRRRKLYVVSRVGGDQLSLAVRTGEG
ncbi:MAG TPA: DNA-processing protein DprA [Solirubrobacteraceae bacterium]|jgi:predicted Rossmann fold nucleotide-binding protein DprA/Smf involved in DNA uptake|nr:DNA-processing protein DprA [Solirubrobacteraceae bacterium]